MTEWLVRQAGSEPIGPVSTGLVLRGLQAGKVRADAEVCRVGTQRWVPIAHVPELTGSAFDDDTETNVTDSPWFMHEAPSMQRPPPRPAPPPPGLGLPPPRPPLQSQTRVEPPPTRPAFSRPSPASMTRPSHGMAAGQGIYGEVDDDAQTRVATPASEAPPLDYEVDDETMTHVAAPTPGPRPAPAPAARRERASGVLPTMPMAAAFSERMSKALPSPRPAAGAPAQASLLGPREPVPPTESYAQMPDVEVHPNMQVPVGSFPPVGAPPQQVAPEYMQPPPPPGYPPYGPPGMPPQYGQAPLPAHSGDQGLKALVALIVFLAVALAVVVILLIVRH